jgi:hypothetical protein
MAQKTRSYVIKNEHPCNDWRRHETLCVLQCSDLLSVQIREIVMVAYSYEL